MYKEADTGWATLRSSDKERVETKGGKEERMRRGEKRDKGIVIGRNGQEITGLEIKAPEKKQNQEEI